MWAIFHVYRKEMSFLLMVLLQTPLNSMFHLTTTTILQHTVMLNTKFPVIVTQA